MNRPVLLAFLIATQVISSTICNTVHDKIMVEQYKLKQLIPPINDQTPQVHDQVALYFRIYKLNDLNQSIVSKWNTFSLGYRHTPACIDYIASKMGLKERVIFTCPQDQGLSTLIANDFELDHSIIKQDLVIDMQLWKYGDNYQVVE